MCLCYSFRWSSCVDFCLSVLQTVSLVGSCWYGKGHTFHLQWVEIYIFFFQRVFKFFPLNRLLLLLLLFESSHEKNAVILTKKWDIQSINFDFYISMNFLDLFECIYSLHTEPALVIFKEEKNWCSVLRWAS